MVFDVNMRKNFSRKSWFFTNGQKNKTPAAMTYSSVVSSDSVRIALTISSLNYLDLLACYIQKVYLATDFIDQVWVVDGTKFGYEYGKNMMVIKAIYVLNISSAAFRDFLVETLYSMGCRSSYVDPDLWLRPSVKTDGLEYYRYIIFYVDNVLCI